MDPNKKARIDSNHPGIPASLGFANPLLKRMQQEEPEEEERSPQKKIMYVPPPTRLEPLRMATRRANVVQLLTTPLTDPRYMGRHAQHYRRHMICIDKCIKPITILPKMILIILQVFRLVEK